MAGFRPGNLLESQNLKIHHHFSVFYLDFKHTNSQDYEKVEITLLSKAQGFLRNSKNFGTFIPQLLFAQKYSWYFVKNGGERSKKVLEAFMLFEQNQAKAKSSLNFSTNPSKQ